MSLHSSSSVEMVQYPERTTRQTSSASARRSMVRPSSSRRTSKPTYSHPADSGVTFTTLPSASGRSLMLTSRSATLYYPSLKVTTLGLLSFGVLLARGDHRLHLGDLRDRDVPERLVARHALVAVHGDVDHDGPVHVFSLGQGVIQLVHGLRPDHVRPEALRVRREVHGQHLAGILLRIQADRTVLAVAVLGAEALGADRAGERADGGEPRVVHQDHRELVALLDRGDYLRAHHQVGAVADHDVDLALWGGHLHAEAAGYLVAHRRVAVLDVVALRVARSPELVQVPRHRAGRAHNHVLGLGERVHSPYDLALRRQRTVPQRVEPLDLPVPLSRSFLSLLPVLAIHLEAGEQSRESFKCRPGVADECEAGVFVGVEVRDVDVHEAHPRVLEGGLRRCGEVRPAGADADDQVRFAGGAVGGEGARGPHGAQSEGMIVGHRALPGLRLPDRDACPFDETPQDLGRLGVDHTPTRDDHGPPGAPDQLRSTLQRLLIRQRAPYAPDALVEELLGEVVGFGLHVLGQRQGHGSGLGLVGQDAHGGQSGGDELFGAVYAGERRPRDHVGRAGSYGARASERLEPVLLPGVGCGGVDHRLLVPRLVVGELVPILLERLSDSGDVAVSEDAEGTGEQALLHPVALDVLVGQEPDQRLRCRQTYRVQVISSSPVQAIFSSCLCRYARLLRTSPAGPSPSSGSVPTTVSCSSTYQPR